MDDARHWRVRWRGAGYSRRRARRDEETAYSTARCRDWHLSADVGDFRSHNRCGTSSLVRWTWSLDAEPRACAATRNARGIGIDCRRKHLGRDQCRPYRWLLEGCADCARAGEFCARAVAWRDGLRRVDWGVVRLDV